MQFDVPTKSYGIASMQLAASTKNPGWRQCNWMRRRRTPDGFITSRRSGGGWWVLCPSGGLGPTGMLAQQQLQGRTAYGPRVCVDKGRARRRRDIGPTSLRQPQPPLKLLLLL